MSAFKEAQIEQLVSRGWSTCDHIAGLVQERGLPAISLDYELLACERDWSMVVSVVGAYARGSHLPLSRWVS
ncbi:MAG TPA: hypothetical protein VGD71_20380 [Kribbella sp.]